MNKRSVFLQEMGIEEWQIRSSAGVELDDSPADWMIIGSALTDQTVKLLEKLLAGIGVYRGQQAHIVDVLSYCTAGKNFSSPDALSPEARTKALALLKQQIALTAPKILLLFGPWPAQLLLGNDSPMEQLLSHTHELSVNEGTIPVVVTYHLADLLRRPTEKAKVWADLCLARVTFQRLSAVAA